MKVRVLQSFDVYRRGSEFDWPAPMVKILQARGLVESLEPADSDAVEAAVLPEERTERAVTSSKPRKRRKA